jgi:hypothetical protein
MPGGLVMVCRPGDAAESDMGRVTENESGTRMPRLGGAGESKAPVREQATRSTTLARRRSEPPQRGWG